MSNGSQRAGRYTNFFTSISAADVNVPGLAPGSAGSRGAASEVLTSTAGLFSIGPDVAALIAQAAAVTRHTAPVPAYMLAAD